jgi:tetratricopeptide (TPR) repeat protein
VSLRDPIALLLALAIALAPIRSAFAEPRDDARAHYQKGRSLFDAGAFREAIAEFEAADRIAPSPLLRFNVGLAYEKLGDAATAATHFRAYLAALPDADNRAAVEAKLKKLDAVAKAEAAKKAKSADGLIEPAYDDPAPAPAAPTPLPSVDVPAPAPAPAPAAPVDDPELARVAAIDVRGIRDERRARGEIGPPAAAPAGTTAPSGEPGAAPAPAPAAPPSDGDDDPVYKKWWFWVGVGVAALIIIDIAASDPDDDETSGSGRRLPFGGPDGRPGTPAGGAVLFRF